MTNIFMIFVYIFISIGFFLAELEISYRIQLAKQKKETPVVYILAASILVGVMYVVYGYLPLEPLKERTEPMLIIALAITAAGWHNRRSHH